MGCMSLINSSQQAAGVRRLVNVHAHFHVHAYMHIVKCGTVCCVHSCIDVARCASDMSAAAVLLSQAAYTTECGMHLDVCVCMLQGMLWSSMHPFHAAAIHPNPSALTAVCLGAKFART